MSSLFKWRQLGSGLWRDLLLRFRLMLRLMGDNRVSILLKLIPFVSLLYLIWPLDFLFGPIDDAVVIWFGIELFVQLCPQTIVSEHMRDLNTIIATQDKRDTEKLKDVVDAEFTEVEKD